MSIIEIRGLRKSFRSRGGKGSGVVEAVTGIDLAVESGEIFGFLGPNGAGKSTTLRMLATLLAPDGGKAVVAGHDLLRSPLEVRRRIGYVSQAGGTDRAATGREDLHLQARLYGLGKRDARGRAEELVSALDLSGFVDRPSRTYSGGQRRKLDIALGMVHQPAVLFLDEPTTGLDPVSRAQLWGRIRLLKEMGTTVFLTTHYMDEADLLCDRVAIMDSGRIAAEGTPTELKRRISGDMLTLRVNHAGEAPALARQALASLEGVRDLSAEADRLRLVVTSGGEALPAVLRLLEGRGISVAEIALTRPSLDDVFLSVTGHCLADGREAVEAGARRRPSASAA
jgi:ABC-2 type transport system ATP-binding protein